MSVWTDDMTVWVVMEGEDKYDGGSIAEIFEDEESAEEWVKIELASDERRWEDVINEDGVEWRKQFGWSKQPNGDWTSGTRWINISSYEVIRTTDRSKNIKGADK